VRGGQASSIFFSYWVGRYGKESNDETQQQRIKRKTIQIEKKKKDIKKVYLSIQNLFLSQTTS